MIHTFGLVGFCCWVSCKACNLHLISSVGHKVSEEKNAAKNPAEAFAKGLRSSTFYKASEKRKKKKLKQFMSVTLLSHNQILTGTSIAHATPFWHTPYPWENIYLFKKD